MSQKITKIVILHNDDPNKGIDNGQSNNNKWVVYIRAPIGNTLTVGHK